MQQDRKEGPAEFWAGLVAAVPIALGYVPIAFAFGVAARSIGLSAPEAFCLSLLMYSGGAQFLSLALVSAGASLPVAAGTLIAMGVRHVLYGPALMKRAGPVAPRRWAWAWTFGLTDEVFGSALGALARGRSFSAPFMFGLALGAYGAWLSGTLGGALAGGSALQGWPHLQAGLDFMLPALFLALLLSILSRAQWPVIAAAAAVTVAVSLIWSATLGLLAGMVAGAITGLLAGKGGTDAG